MRGRAPLTREGLVGTGNQVMGQTGDHALGLRASQVVEALQPREDTQALLLFLDGQARRAAA